ncbi:DNA-directed RNA polymerase III subunit Rpc5 [Gilbertella persicaria]|uniref:DNA-directed RNA polymerase III subunit Rpc5 n=1 Tax=Gilbertella persicaria TaxID=101096 RepID=UPI00221E80FD|nr:DNA-directed RNA polymerase III subunit Rpc5 [Gilbertella persicaria]KAI8079691.1 DNA-directed RNA polymerase III subunit Rpc5 [Gilbertella persicaria]
MTLLGKQDPQQTLLKSVLLSKNRHTSLKMSFFFSLFSLEKIMSDMDETMTYAHLEEDDEVLAEYPIYLTNELSKYLYMFQFPMRSIPFNGRNGPNAARIKPKAKMVELDLPLDTRSTNYSTERGEDFAMGLNDKAIKTAYDRRMEEHEEELSMGHNYNRGQKKKEEELLDKMTLTSTEVPTQTKYVIGVIRNEELHVTPISTTVQLRPGFKYIDKIDEKWKAANKRIQDVEKQEEKKRNTDPEKAQTLQVSVKNAEPQGIRRNLYSMAVRNAEEEDWQPIVYYDENSLQAEKVSEKLYSTSKEELECTTAKTEYLDLLSSHKTSA